MKVSQIEGSLFDMLTQNNPFSESIKSKSELGVSDYLILSKDFNFKTQLVRCLEINADNSYKLILDSINKMNHYKYSALLENDLVRIMEKNDIRDIFYFFKVSQNEDVEEMIQGQKNLFCNFEFTLVHELIPNIWNTNE